MTKLLRYKPLFALLISLTFWSACNAQNKSLYTTDILNKLKSSYSAQPKLIRTQSTSKYNNITCAIQDRKGIIWFGTDSDGVYTFDGSFFTQYTTKEGLICNSIRSLLEDKDGNIWFGTRDGICKTDGKTISSVPISFFIRPTSTSNTYYNQWATKNTVWSMMQDKTGKIWFGIGDGVYCYEGGTFTRFLADGKVINKDSLHLRLVAALLEDKDGIIWFASGMPPGYEGLCRFDGKAIKAYKPKKEGWFRNVLESKNGNLLLATRHFGVWSYDGKSFTDYSQPKELYKASLNAILEDKAGNLWIASNYGIAQDDTLGGLWYSSSSASNPAAITFTKIFNKEVYFLFEDKDHSIWFGSRNMELYKYDRKKIIKYSE